MYTEPHYKQTSLFIKVNDSRVKSVQETCLSIVELTNDNRCDVPTLSNPIGGYNTDTIIQARIEGRECCVTNTIPAAVRADHPLLHYHPYTVQQRHRVVELAEGADI